jgi:hypothetical protein
MLYIWLLTVHFRSSIDDETVPQSTAAKLHAIRKSKEGLQKPPIIEPASGVGGAHICDGFSVS